MAVEVARELPVKEVEIETPLETTRGLRLRDEVAVVPVLRAGLGMVEGFLRLLPDARVGHVGIYRDEEEHVPVGYYERLPPGLPRRARVRARSDARDRRQRRPALDHLKRAGARQLELVCLVSAPEGIEAVERPTPTCRSGRPRSTASSTRTPTSARAWATPATACSARPDRRRAIQPLVERAAARYDASAIEQSAGLALDTSNVPGARRAGSARSRRGRGSASSGCQ